MLKKLWTEGVGRIREGNNIKNLLTTQEQLFKIYLRI